MTQGAKIPEAIRISRKIGVTVSVNRRNGFDEAVSKSGTTDKEYIQVNSGYF